MKYSFLFVLAVLPMLSCSGNDDSITESPKPAEKEVYRFQYKNYTVQNISVYKGPSGQKTNPAESYLDTYWSTYKEPAWKSINLNLKNNSLQLISGTSADIIYPMKIEKDSVFINENDGKSFIGIFNKGEASFTLKRSLKYIKKMPREDINALIISQKVTFGVTDYQDIFGNSIFSNPSEMTETGDDILWSNIDYHYSSL